MRTFHPVVLAASFAVLLATVTPALAQNPPDRRRVELAVGANVVVTTNDGKTQEGRLVTTFDTELVLRDGGRRRYVLWTDIRQVDRHFDVSIAKSTLSGLGIGVGVGLMALGTGGCTEDAGTFALECIGLWAGTGAGAGALTGLIINAVRPARTIYRDAQGSGLFIAPVVSKNRFGLAGTIRW